MTLQRKITLSRRQMLCAAATAVVFGTLGGSRPSYGAAKATLKITDSQGAVSVPLTPQRVVVFDLAALDILDALGVRVIGVPTGPKPRYLTAYDGEGYSKVGSLFEPDFEAVNALEPDLIVVGNRSASKRTELAAIAPTIDLTFDSSALVESVFAHTRLLGTIFDRNEQAETLIKDLKAQLAQVRDLSQQAGTALFLMTTGGRVSTYGPQSRFNMVFDAFGLTPAIKVDQAGPHGQVVSYEFILKTNPDWLLVLDRDAAVGREGQAAQVLLDNDLVHQTRAWQAGQILYLDAAAWYLGGGGAQSLAYSMKQVMTALQKA